MNASEEENIITYMAVEQPQASMQGTNKYQHKSGDVQGSGNLDKVRDILFGTQIRDYDKRFARLEERLVQECANLREDTRRRLDSLETYIKQEVESLTDWIKNQQAERDEAVEELAQEDKDTIKSLDKKIAQLDAEATKSDRDLRQQILDQSKSLNDEIRQKYEEILAVLEREAKVLRTDKTDRSTLAALFAEIAMRLNSNSL
jgi:DNA repair exonuclease SbcCD ATPase subunit